MSTENAHVAAIKHHLGRLGGMAFAWDRNANAHHREVEKNVDALAAALAEANRKIEFYEWMAYQRKQRPGITDEDILRLTYVSEWRGHDTDGGTA